MKVGFDFDSTLSRKDVQEFAKELVNDGHEVWIVTSRFDDETAMQKNWHWIKGQNQKLFLVFIIYFVIQRYSNFLFWQIFI